MSCNQTNNRISTVNVFLSFFKKVHKKVRIKIENAQDPWKARATDKKLRHKKQNWTQNSQKLILCTVMCDVVNLEFFNDKLATTGSAWKIFYFPCHAYLTYSNCDSLSCSKTGPQCTALLKFICAFTRFVNIQVVWPRTVLFIRWTYVAKCETLLSKFFKKFSRRPK